MQVLRVYKLIATDDNPYKINLVDEYRWLGKYQFCVWVSYIWLNEFIEELKDILSEGMFDDGGFDGNFQYDCVCLNLSNIVDAYGIDLEEIFPYEEE